MRQRRLEIVHATLALIPGFRERTQCSYWDYEFNSHRLAERLEVGDLIPPFGWLAREVEECFALMLLRKRDSDLRPGRVPLFVCPECADYGCGVVSCRVTRQDNLVEWSDFGRETDYENSLHQNERVSHLKILFDATQYHSVFQRFVST